MISILCTLFLGVNLVFANSITNIDGNNARIFEKEVTEWLECIRGVLKTGIPEVDLPSLEPIEIPEVIVDVGSLGISGSSGEVTVQNAVISGLTDWELSDLKIKANIIGGLGGTVNAKITLPTFDIRTNYVADLIASGVTVFGDGEIRMALGHLQFDVDLKMLLNRISVAKFRMLPSLETIDFKITGFLNDEEHSQLASQIVNDIGVRWINEKSEDFANIIEKFVQGLVNKSNIRMPRDINDIVNAVLEKCPLPF